MPGAGKQYPLSLSRFWKFIFKPLSFVAISLISATAPQSMVTPARQVQMNLSPARSLADTGLNLFLI
jgi:hypothetical protein